MDDSEPPEFQALRDCSHKLAELIKHDVHDLASILIAKGLITEETESRTRLNSTGTEVANAILGNVKSAVKVNPHLYSDFLDSLNGTYYDNVKKELEGVLHTRRGKPPSQCEVSRDFVGSSHASSDTSPKGSLCPLTVAQQIQDVHKLRSLGIMLGMESCDWEYIRTDGPPDSIRARLAYRWIKSGTNVSLDELERIMLQPALKEVRIAQNIRQFSRGYSGDSGISIVDSLSSSRSSTTGFVPVQYQASHIEKIGQRKECCTRQSVLNCVADYPEWDSIGNYLIGIEEVEKIKQDPSMSGDQAAYMIEQWWRSSRREDFSWVMLETAIMNTALGKYGRTFCRHESSLSDSLLPEDCKSGDETYTEVEELQNIFEDLQVEIMEELSREDLSMQTFKFKLTSARHYPEYSNYLMSVLSKPYVKTVQHLFGHISKCWSFLDCGLLDVIIGKFGSVVLKHKMKKYTSDLRIFQKKTTIAPFVRALQKRNFHPRKPNEAIFKKLIETIEQNPNICTLAHLDVLRTRHYDKLRELSLSQVALMVYDRVELCCVRITWLLLSEQVKIFEQMFEACTLEGTFFDQNTIICLELDGRVFMTMERMLLEASKRGDVNCMDVLLEKWDQNKHDINRTDEDGKTCLILASELGYAGVVALLLEQHQLDIDYQMKGKLWTALFFAYSSGHWGTVKLLREYGANGELKDRDGKRAADMTIVKKGKMGLAKKLGSGLKKMLPFFKKRLIGYCEIGKYEAVKELLRKKQVDVNMTDGFPRNWTPLMWACTGGHYEVAELLIENGADVNVKSTKNDWTALLLAVTENYVRIANLLLKNSANPNSLLSSKYSALLYISDMGYIEMARTLLKHGADVEIATTMDGSTPLIEAACSGDEELVKLYLEYNANPNRQAHKGWTALMEAARVNNRKIAKMLIESGADTELVMEGAGKTTGESSLHVACYKGSENVVGELLERGAQVNKMNAAGLTPLMLATNRGKVDTVKTLLGSKFIDVNLPQMDSGFPAMAMAAKNGDIKICQLLLEHGANIEIDDFSIMDVATLYKQKAICEMLHKYNSIHSQVQVAGKGQQEDTELKGMQPQGQGGLRGEMELQTGENLQPLTKIQAQTELQAEDDLQEETEVQGETELQAAELQVGTELQTEIELQPQTETELQPQPQTELQLQTETELQPQTETELQPQTETELQPQRATELQLQTETELQPQRETELQPQTETELQSQTETELQPQTETELQPQTETELQPQTETELQSQTETELQPQTETELQPQTETELQPQRETELQLQTETELQPQRETELQLQTETELQPQTETELQSQTETELQPQTELQPEKMGPRTEPPSEVVFIEAVPETPSAAIVKEELTHYEEEIEPFEKDRIAPLPLNETVVEVLGTPLQPLVAVTEAEHHKVDSHSSTRHLSEEQEAKEQLKKEVREDEEEEEDTSSLYGASEVDEDVPQSSDIRTTEGKNRQKMELLTRKLVVKDRMKLFDNIWTTYLSKINYAGEEITSRKGVQQLRIPYWQEQVIGN